MKDEGVVMKIIADTHTHTIISGDAHSTLLENIREGKKRGMQFLCATEHVNSVPRAAAPAYFKSLCALPREFEGVRIVRGVEANIVNYDGQLDMPDDLLDWLDWVIASMHDVVIRPGTKEEHTKCWLKIAENPLVDIIGHCGDPRYAFDLDVVIPAFKRYGKVVEINNHSFEGGRVGSPEGCRKVAQACMKYGVPVVVSSDAHFAGSVGVFDHSLAMLRSIGFPEEMILNADAARFEKFLASKITQP